MKKGKLNALMMLSIIAIFAMSLSSGCISSKSSSGGSAMHTIGNGKDDFWIDYPEQHPKSGQNVEHPQWVSDALEEKPLIILAHSTNCYPCILQQSAIKDLMSNYTGKITYIDILTDGSDNRAMDVYNVYYPQAGQWYIPLTAIISKAEYNGKERVIWHAAVGETGKDWLKEYMDDAIYYYGV